MKKIKSLVESSKNKKDSANNYNNKIILRQNRMCKQSGTDIALNIERKTLKESKWVKES